MAKPTGFLEIERRDRDAGPKRLGHRGQIAGHRDVGSEDMAAGEGGLDQHGRHRRDAAEGARKAEIEGHEIGHCRQVIRRPGKATSGRGAPRILPPPAVRPRQFALGKKSCSPPTVNEAIAA